MDASGERGESGHQFPLMPPISPHADAGDKISDKTPELRAPAELAPQTEVPPSPPAAPPQQAAAPGYAYPYPYVYPYPQASAGAGTFPGAPQWGQPVYPNAAGQPGSQPSGAIPPSARQGANGGAPTPGYPAYPQGLPTTYAPYPPNPPVGSAPYGAGGYGNGYGYGYPAYGYAFPYAYPMYPVYAAPKRAPGETLALVVSWIVTVFGGLSILCGLFAGLIFGVIATRPGDAGLAALAVFAEITIAPTVAGGFALYFGIRGILRRPSARFSIPSPALFLVLTLLALGAGVALWHLAPTPGSPVLVLPLVFLAGILPAFTILAFTARRLGLPSTRRHVWMSLLYGLTLAPLLATILELIATVIIAQASGTGSAALSLPANLPSSPLLIFVLLLTVSVVAPVVEEGVKPLGAVLLMRRLRSPASAFLLGMAAGVGFDIFETIGYIGMGQADWIAIAIERVGAGLLHGVGAGMAALGWYYLINGKGVSGRWLRGIGCIAYAVVQHAVFNGIFLVGDIRGVGEWLAQSWYIGGLPFQHADFLYFGLYLIILGVLYVVTGRLAGERRPPSGLALPVKAEPAEEPMNSAGSAAVGSGAR